jgi:hypothetical protein
MQDRTTHLIVPIGDRGKILFSSLELNISFFFDDLINGKHYDI